QLAHHTGLAHRVFQKPGDAIRAAAARARHAIERVGPAPHTTGEGPARVFFPGVTVPSAHTDLLGDKFLGRFECARYLRGKSDSFDYIDIFEQLVYRRWRRILDKIRTLRSTFVFRNEGPFDMDSGDLRNGLPGITDALKHINDDIERGRGRRQQKRSRPTAQVKIANRAKCIRGSLHRVAAERAVQMKINKP